MLVFGGNCDRNSCAIPTIECVEVALLLRFTASAYWPSQAGAGAVTRLTTGGVGLLSGRRSPQFCSETSKL